MKRLTFVITLIITAFYSLAQWELQNPIPTDANMNDIFYVDDDNGWAVGEHGTIMSTDNGGQNWELQLNISSPLESIFTAVYFTDLLNGWAVGYSYVTPESEWTSMIYHTDDGGSSWENQYSAPTEYFNDIWFVNPDTGWVVGAESNMDDGVILYTENGGVNWEEQYRVNFKYLSGICFTDSENGCAVGAQGHIVNTSNGGETWEVRTSYTSLTFTSVCFTGLNSGWALGRLYNSAPDAKILHTQDGGNSWEINYEFGEFGASDVGAIFFVDENNGWVTFNTYQVEGGVTCHILATTNGGETWDSYYNELTPYIIPSIHFIDPIEGWAVRNNVIIHSTDGGQNWTPQNSITQTDFNSICAVNDSSVWAAGYEHIAPYTYRNTLLHSYDAGTTWVELNWGGGKRIKDMHFIDENHGWIVTSSSNEDGGNIGRTVDGGLNWVIWQPYIWEDLSSVNFIDSLNGWVVGSSGTILHTEDGGITWEEQTSGATHGLVDLCFTDLSNGWIVGGERIILHTSNGGESWETQSISEEGYLKSVCFIDEDHGWAVGEMEIIPNNSYDIIYTSDGGETWEQSYVTSEFSLNDIYFTDQMNGWAVGRSGTIISTNNGGDTWVEQESESYNNLNSIQMINSQMGWAVGYNGVILHTNNGGTVGFEEPSLPYQNKLQLNLFPNPFTTSTTISYQLNQPSKVSIHIYNHLGELVEMIEQHQQQGKQQVIWNAESQPAGIYYFRLEAGEQTASGKVVLVR